MNGTKDLRLVEFAVALARHRSFARAAEAMHVSQPTFSRGIAALEASLGVRLFDRSTRRVEPTATGLAYVAQAETLLAEASRLTEAVSQQDGLLQGPLTVGVGPLPLELSVLPATVRLHKRHPSVRLRLIEGQWRDIIDKLLSGTVDLVVMETSVLADDHRLEVEPLPRHSGVLVCRAGHPLAAKPRVSLEDLEPYPLVGVPMTRTITRSFGGVVGRLDVDHSTGDINPHVTVTTTTGIREVVRHTDAVGLCVAAHVADDCRAGRLAILTVDFEMPSTGYGFAWLRGRRLTPAAQEFMQLVREAEAAFDSAATRSAPPVQPVTARAARRSARPSRENRPGPKSTRVRSIRPQK